MDTSSQLLSKVCEMCDLLVGIMQQVTTMSLALQSLVQANPLLSEGQVRPTWSPTRDDMEHFLLRVLAAGPVPVSDVMRLAKAEGFSEHTLSAFCTKSDKFDSCQHKKRNPAGKMQRYWVWLIRPANAPPKTRGARRAYLNQVRKVLEDPAVIGMGTSTELPPGVRDRAPFPEDVFGPVTEQATEETAVSLGWTPPANYNPDAGYAPNVLRKPSPFENPAGQVASDPDAGVAPASNGKTRKSKQVGGPS